jgi:hypothetical protein
MASLPQLPLHSKATSVALLILSSSSLRALGVRVQVGCSMSALCRELRVPRSTAYALVRRISSLLEGGTGEETCTSEVQVSQNKVLTQVLRYQVENPGSVRVAGKTTYSKGYRELVLSLLPGFPGTRGQFAKAVGVPLGTLESWTPGGRGSANRAPAVDPEDKEPLSTEGAGIQDSLVLNPLAISDTRGLGGPGGGEGSACKEGPDWVISQVLAAFAKRRGTVKSFLCMARERFGLLRHQAVAILRLGGCIRPKDPERYLRRGTTERGGAGSVVIMDGQVVKIFLLGEGEEHTRNIQGAVCQGTGYPYPQVVSNTEGGASLTESYRLILNVQGRAPQAILVDRKPCYQEKQFLEILEGCTELLLSTPNRPQNKAGVEGWQGLRTRFMPQVVIDNRTKESLVTSVTALVAEAFRQGYVHRAGVGKSLHQEFQSEQPQRERDQRIVERLKQTHGYRLPPRRRRPASWRASSLELLGKHFNHPRYQGVFPARGLEHLSKKVEPQAVQAALMQLEVCVSKGLLEGKDPFGYFETLAYSAQNSLEHQRHRHSLESVLPIPRSFTAALEAEAEGIEQGFQDQGSVAAQFLCRHQEAEGPLAQIFWEKRLARLIDGGDHLQWAIAEKIFGAPNRPEAQRVRLVQRLLFAAKAA